MFCLLRPRGRSRPSSFTFSQWNLAGTSILVPNDHVHTLLGWTRCTVQSDHGDPYTFSSFTHFSTKMCSVSGVPFGWHEAAPCAPAVWSCSRSYQPNAPLDVQKNCWKKNRNTYFMVILYHREGDLTVLICMDSLDSMLNWRFPRRTRVSILMISVGPSLAFFLNSWRICSLTCSLPRAESLFRKLL